MVFESGAGNLVSGDTNSRYDIFRKDLQTGAVVRISVGADGAEGNSSSESADISADGRYVVFESRSTNLVAGDTNDGVDIFRKDLATGAIVRVSTAADGRQAKAGSSDAKISADGRYVTFESSASNLVADDSNSLPDVFRKDLTTGAIIRLSTTAEGAEPRDGESIHPSLSSDGRYAIFESYASDLVAGDTNEDRDIFKVDTSLVSHRSAIADGRYVQATFGVGPASKVSVNWGDGTTDSASPANGAATFEHEYATAGVKTAFVMVSEGAQTWIVPHRVDLGAAQMTRDTALLDRLSGSDAKDALTGDAFGNIIKGAGGNDTVTGLGGRDIVYGGAGKDILSGGADKDVFVFDTKANKKTNLDKITDFSVKDDTIWLDNAVFKALGKGSEEKPGKLNKAFFKVSNKALDANDHLIYDPRTGVLSYDRDGTGGGAEVEIAIVKKHLKMTLADFLVM